MKDDTTLSRVEAILGYEKATSLIEEVIQKYEQAGLSENQFCKMLSIPRFSWQRFVSGRQQNVDVALLIKLADFLEKPAGEVVDAYRQNVKKEEREELDDVKRWSFIVNHFDVKSLRKIKFFTGKITDFAAVEERIKQFFLIDKVYEYKEIEVKTLYSRTRRTSSDRMLQFWNTLVRFELQTLDNPNGYDREQFKAVLARFRAATLDVEFGFAKIVQALYKCGITVIVQSYVSKTAIRGATFVIKGKPYIVLTNLGKRYATLWQTLAHECYHIFTRLDELTRQGYRVNSDEKELFDNELDEDAANQFARQLFFDDENTGRLEKYIDFEKLIEQLAISTNVHPSLLYNIYLEKHPEQHAKFSRFLFQSYITVQNLEVKDPWQEPTVKIPISKLRKVFEPAELTK